jgi:beta-glucanase (GH16 family)
MAARQGNDDLTSADWKRVWSDEFDYTGPPDPKKWDYEEGFIRNEELQLYTRRRENVRVENGMLILEARREKTRNPAYKAGSDRWQEKREFAEYTAASINTLGRAGWQYGRFVVRAKLPKTLGSWPAVWMMGEDIRSIGWPRCGEIDIMEHVAHNPAVIHATIHQPGIGKPHMSKGGTIRIPDYGDAFHVYATEWYPDRLDFFVDDRKYFTFPNEGPEKWTFSKKFYLLLNFAVGGAWGGQKGVDEKGWPQQYLIDYVRVYEKK